MAREARREPVAPGHDPTTATAATTDLVLRRPFQWPWILGFGLSLGLVVLLVYASVVLFVVGVGVWGHNIPVAWAFDLINYVWWIGIANAASLLAASLVLLQKEWRTAINRFAEGLALFAAICTGVLPILHLGRPWLFYWVFPYPNTMDIWPQFRSPLVWDFFGILGHLVVTALFWYVGLLPDLATLRDRARTRLGRIAYGVVALGWRGSAAHWKRHHTAYILLAAMVLPFLVLMQSIVSFEFAATVVPGWHKTILPPHLVFSGIASGVATVAMVAVVLRRALGVEDFITRNHLDLMGKVLLASSLLVAYAYGMEAFTAWYSGDIYERQEMANRAFGPYGPIFWLSVVLIVLVSQALWWPRLRRGPLALFAIGLLVNIGVWLDRFVIVVVPLHRDFLPSAWRMYYPTPWEIFLLIGTLGVFAALLFLFSRFLPVVFVYETQKLVQAGERGDAR